MSIRLLAAVMVLALTVAGATADAAVVVVTPRNAMASAEDPTSGRMATNTINGSGLDGIGPVTNQTHSTSPGMWWAGIVPATITWDLGGGYNLHGFHLWNYNEATWSAGGTDFSKRGVKTADISVSADGVTFTTVRSGMTLTKAPGGLWPTGEGLYRGEDYTLTANNVRFVRMNATANFGGSGIAGVGLSEIRFYGEDNSVPLVPSEYKMRMKISFTRYDRAEPLTNFPVMIRLREGQHGFSYSQMAAPATGGDLRLADAANSNLAYQVESWGGATNGESVIWARLPQLTSNTWIWAYWGHPTATNPVPGVVWNNDHRGVWHLAEANPPFRDASGNLADATAASVGTGKEGVAAGGQEFSDSTNHIQTPLTAKYQNFTLSALVKPQDMTGSRDIQILLSKASYWATAMNDFPVYLSLNNTGANASLAVDSGNDWSSDLQVSLGGVQTGAWNYVAGMYDGTTLTVFVNGQAATANGTVTLSSNSRNWTLGRAAIDYSGGANRSGLKGYLDEARIANVAQGTNWLWASYMNLLQHDTFVHYWPAEVSGSSGTLIIIR